MLYGAQVWDPVLIIGQIIALQCLFYIGLGLFLAALVAPYVSGIALDHVFDWRWNGLQSFESWMISLAFMLNALCMAVMLRLVVKRAKKCLDFASTMYIIHLLVVSIYSGFPLLLTWWITSGSALAITAALGEWLCLQEELKEIPLSSIPQLRSRSTLELTSLSVEK